MTLAGWIVAIGVVASTGAAQNPTPAAVYKAPPAPAQPIAYSHKIHMAEDLECVNCHATAKTGDHATLPPTATCMRCHATVERDSAEIQKLAAYDARREDVPWVRVYRLPDYVYFSHQVHLAPGQSTTCETCHGNVREMSAMQRVGDISMAACIDCHKQRSATVRCDACHEAR